MRLEELRALSTADLVKDLESTYRELFNLRFRAASRQLADFSAIGKAKKKVSRMKTILRERELAAAISRGRGA
ncbi:MAG: 50S ribosomal protein L29 [Chloroflexi bacterium]|nr:50S ribosomal protein L29 [Chloroflexota bacterium]